MDNITNYLNCIKIIMAKIISFKQSATSMSLLEYLSVLSLTKPGTIDGL